MPQAWQMTTNLGMGRWMAMLALVAMLKGVEEWMAAMMALRYPSQSLWPCFRSQMQWETSGVLGLLRYCDARLHVAHIEEQR